MDAFTSARMMYTALSVNEKQAEMKEKMSSTFRRGKRDKDKTDEEEGAADVDELSGFNPILSLKKGGSVFAAGLTILMNTFAFIAIEGPVRLISAVVANSTATVVAYREVTMDDIDTVRQASNLLRESVNELAIENMRLSGEVDRLEHSVFCLKETENRLKDITGQQDLNVKNLVNLVAVNQEILDEKQKLVRQDVVADVVQVVLKADMDESGDFSKKEIRRMITYIEGLPSVKVNHSRLERALSKNNSVGSIIDVVNDLARDDIEESKRIFELNWEDKNLVDVLAKKKEKDKAKATKKRESARLTVGADAKAKDDKKQKKSSEEKKTKSPNKDDESHKSPKRESKKKSISNNGDLPVLESPKSPKRESSSPKRESKSPKRESKKASASGKPPKKSPTTDLETFLDTPKSKKSKSKSKEDSSEISTDFSTASKKSKKKTKLKTIDLDDSIASELSLSKRSKKKSKSSDNDSVSSKKKSSKKKSKGSDSDSDVSSAKKRKSSKSSKKKSKTLTRMDSHRSLEEKGASTRPGLIRKSSSLEDLSKKSLAESGKASAGRHLLLDGDNDSPGSGGRISIRDPPAYDSTSPKPSKPPLSSGTKKKGLLGFGLADKVKKRLSGDSDSSDSD